MPELITSAPELTVVYGPATPDDAAAMRQLRGDNWMNYARTPEEAEFLAGQVAEYCGPSGVVTEQGRIESSRTEPDSNYYFQTARIDGQLAGYIAGFREHPDIPGVQEVGALHVNQKILGRGIGGRLLEAFFRDVGETKPTVLDTVAGVPAVGFYRSKGFKKWDERAEEWGPLETIMMRKEQA